MPDRDFHWPANPCTPGFPFLLKPLQHTQSSGGVTNPNDCFSKSIISSPFWRVLFLKNHTFISKAGLKSCWLLSVSITELLGLNSQSLPRHLQGEQSPGHCAGTAPLGPACSVPEAKPEVEFHFQKGQTCSEIENKV